MTDVSRVETSWDEFFSSFFLFEIIYEKRTSKNSYHKIFIDRGLNSVLVLQYSGAASYLLFLQSKKQS